MNLILSSALLLCIVASAFGAGCNYKGKAFKVGEKYAPLGECVEYTCDKKDGGYHALTCPVAAGTANCEIIPEDLSKPYPKCCEQYTCSNRQ